MDCPELDPEDICDDCRFEAAIAEQIEAIDLILNDALLTKHSRKHRDGKTAEHIDHALAHLDMLSDLLFE